jgi:hypothetical protein
MKIHNLTDVETPKLKQQGLVGQSIAVGPALLNPGEAGDVAEEHVAGLRQGMHGLVSIGALAVGPQPPAAYVLAKEKAKAAAAEAEARNEITKPDGPVTVPAKKA